MIITGASGNLGKITVHKFIQEGYTIAAVLAPGETLDQFKDHPQVDIHHADLMNESETGVLIARIIEKYKTIDAALLLAGGYDGGGIENTTGTMLKKMYSLNFETTYHVARPVFGQMKKQSAGRIIFMGARPALISDQAKSAVAYALSKSLVLKLADILNAEGAAHNVTATVIVPSIIDTPANRKAMPGADFSAWVKPEDIAAAMVFVVSSAAVPLRETVLKMYGNT